MYNCTVIQVFNITFKRPLENQFLYKKGYHFYIRLNDNDNDTDNNIKNNNKNINDILLSLVLHMLYLV